MENLRKNSIFKKDGKTYLVKGFNADKWGVRYAVCDWLEEIGRKSSHIFYASDF